MSDTTPATTDFVSRFAPIVAAHRGGAFLRGETRAALALHAEGDLLVAWSPFDHVPAAARLVVVGITPGAVQAENALAAFCTALKSGSPPAEASRRAKLTGSFSGPMRDNLVAMLDHVGAHRALGVASCSEVFDPARELAHFTSALRHPVFVAGANYNGTPDMLRTPVLRRMVETLLAAEARALPGAVWLPLGPKALAAVRHLVRRGDLDGARVLEGLPHPSGANGERIAYFLGRKPREALSAKTRPDPIDAARAALRLQLAKLVA
jgi:hypothetical protein